MTMDGETQAYLSMELEKTGSVDDVKVGAEVVKFFVSHGEYNAISSEILTVIGRYDCSLYHNDDMKSGEYWLV